MNILIQPYLRHDSASNLLFESLIEDLMQLNGKLIKKCLEISGAYVESCLLNQF